MVILVILGVLALALIVLRLRHSPISRMARLVAEGRYVEAIALARTVPERERDATWQHNLAAAYCGAGETARARELLVELGARPDLPYPLRESVEGWPARGAELRGPPAGEDVRD